MLQQLLTPDWLATSTLAQLPLERLLDQGIRALVLDVDRTLLPRRHTTLPPTAEQWLRHAMHQLPIHLLSNNPSRHRIGSVADRLGLPYTTSAGKPRRTAPGPARQVASAQGGAEHRSERTPRCVSEARRRQRRDGAASRAGQSL